MKNPTSKISLSNRNFGLQLDLQRVYEEIDKFFGSGKEVQSKNYLKFISKGDESDSADDDEPEIRQLSKFITTFFN
jgi:hypothetical protein